MRYSNDPYITRARWKGVCAETGKQINPGDFIAVYPLHKGQVFCKESRAYKDVENLQMADSWGV